MTGRIIELHEIAELIKDARFRLVEVQRRLHDDPTRINSVSGAIYHCDMLLKDIAATFDDHDRRHKVDRP